MQSVCYWNIRLWLVSVVGNFFSKQSKLNTFSCFDSVNSLHFLNLLFVFFDYFNQVINSVMARILIGLNRLNAR